jgi:hypothetical protein
MPHLQLLCCQVCAEHVIIAQYNPVQGQQDEAQEGTQSMPHLQLLCSQVSAEHVIIAASAVQRQEAARRQRSAIPFVHPAAKLESNTTV